MNTYSTSIVLDVLNSLKNKYEYVYNTHRSYE